MIALVFAVIAYCRAFFIGHDRLGMEIAAPRHQLIVFKRKQPRPRLYSWDRAFWGAFRHLWPAWVNALIMVKPDTVVSWHRADFGYSGDCDPVLDASAGRRSAWRLGT